MIDSKWNLSLIPPKGHKDVGEFAWQLFEIARLEKERLNKPNNFLSNYSLYRGHKAGTRSGQKGSSMTDSKNLTMVNLYFANIERTVSNITARVPTGEVIDMDGIEDDVENILSLKLKKWWKDTNQQMKTRSTARLMEIYGITIEKPVQDTHKNEPDILLTDPFSFFPAPGNWSNIAEDAPYISFLYSNFISQIEDEYKVSDIEIDDSYNLLGLVREEYKVKGTSIYQSIGNYAQPMTKISTASHFSVDRKTDKGVIIEVWIRDNRTKQIETPIIDKETGEPVIDEETGTPKVLRDIVPFYPDNIRKVTISKSKDPKLKSGWVVLDDSPNPNINPAHLEYGDDVKHTYPWGKLPAYIANSYEDGMSIWGFAAAEQVGDLISKINLIMTKLIAYVINIMAPPLIIQQHCGITREMIEESINKSGRLILMPSTPNARIEFMSIPNLPATFFQVLDLIVKFFDRIYQIEDADRGVSPKGVIAASAIVALQERNQVLMQTKTSAIDYLAEQRSKWAIGLWQNWGIAEDTVTVVGEKRTFRMVNYVNRKFNFAVESGSTTPRTSLQIQEMAKWLYEAKAIGQKGLLEGINWPNCKEEIQRTAESQLDQALQVLIDAGLPMENAVIMREELMSLKLQYDKAKTEAQGHQPAQPKSMVPKSSNVQSGS